MNEHKRRMIFEKRSMQKYIEGTNRHQSYLSTLEDQVSTDNAVRLIGAFIANWIWKFFLSIATLSKKSKNITDI